jgi:hypothetical protein
MKNSKRSSATTGDEVKKVSINLPTDLIEDVKSIGKDNERNFSQQVSFFLKRSVGRHATRAERIV